MMKGRENKMNKKPQTNKTTNLPPPPPKKNPNPTQNLKRNQTKNQTHQTKTTKPKKKKILTQKATKPTTCHQGQKKPQREERSPVQTDSAVYGG